MASNVSATEMIRASIGISSPCSPSGYPVPSHFSWWYFMPGMIHFSCGIWPMMRAPFTGWSFITSNSSSVSAVGLRRIRSSMPIFPTSWRRAAILTFRTSSAGCPRCRAIATE